ncbi:MAG: hypothetical protein KDA57_07520 [Planctomycetales bacterium]|nr:hypothetical protein [Planctomycetales bacterium]
MLQRRQMLNSFKNGPALIAAGLVVVFAALVWPGVPIAGAILLVGCGATLTLGTRRARQEWLLLANLAVYASLGCLAVAAQTQGALNGPTGQVSGLLLCDHLLALLLFAVLLRWVVRQLVSTVATDR